MNHTRAMVGNYAMIFGMVKKVIGNSSGSIPFVPVLNQAVQVYRESGQSMEAVQMYIASQIPFTSVELPDCKTVGEELTLGDVWGLSPLLPKNIPKDLPTDLPKDIHEAENKAKKKAKKKARKKAKNNQKQVEEKKEAMVVKEKKEEEIEKKKKKKSKKKKSKKKKKEAMEKERKEAIEKKKKEDNIEDKKIDQKKVVETLVPDIVRSESDDQIKAMFELELSKWRTEHNIDEDPRAYKEHSMYEQVLYYAKSKCFPNHSRDEKNSMGFDGRGLAFKWDNLPDTDKMLWLMKTDAAVIKKHFKPTGTWSLRFSRLRELDDRQLYFNVLEMMKYEYAPVPKGLMRDDEFTYWLVRKYTKFNVKNFLAASETGESLETWMSRTWEEKVVWILEHVSEMKYCFTSTFDGIATRHKAHGHMFFKPPGYNLMNEKTKKYVKREPRHWSTGEGDYKSVRYMQKYMLYLQKDMVLVDAQEWAEMSADDKVKYILDKKHWTPAKISNLDEVDAKFLGTL